jgi:hypothetical protein
MSLLDKPIDDLLSYLESCFSYTEEGVIIWKIRPREHFANDQSHAGWNTKFSNKPAGYVKTNYGIISINGEDIKLHNILYILYYREKPIMVDHINGDTLDNRKLNLRNVTKIQNSYNRKLNSNSSTGFKGVYKRYNRYTARISVNGIRKFLGDFDTPEQAYEAYKTASAFYHKDYARKEEHL